MIYKNCPRCGEEWNLGSQRYYMSSIFSEGNHIHIFCGACPLGKYRENNNDTHLILSFEEVFNSGFCSLHWFLNEGYCKFSCGDPLFDPYQEIKLPWLLFDITVEKLKRYLIFS